MAYFEGLDEYNGRISFQVFDLRGRLIVQKYNFSHWDGVMLPSVASGIYIMRVNLEGTRYRPYVQKQFIN